MVNERKSHFMSSVTGHIGINVTDLARSQQFYTDVFDLEHLGGSPDGERRFAFLGHGEQIVLTLWEQGSGTFDPQRPGLHHLSFQADSIEEVSGFQARLKARGAKFFYEGIVPHAEGRASGGIFFEDPDGVRLEIFATSGAEHGHAPSGEAPSCGFF
jgi:catechol 2,3-dioxygenase-like lactoylglutathione lyase family enzyme